MCARARTHACVCVCVHVRVCTHTHIDTYIMGRRGSLVACETCRQRDRKFKSPAGLNLLWRCTPGQGLHPHVHSLDPGVNE